MIPQLSSGGSIIEISSISALTGEGLQTHYTPTKARMLSLMQSCVVALGPHSIRCNAILPGTIATSMNAENLSNETKRQHMERRIAFGRIDEPENIVDLALFLASDMSKYVVSVCDDYFVIDSWLQTLIMPDWCSIARWWWSICQFTITSLNDSRTSRPHNKRILLQISHLLMEECGCSSRNQSALQGAESKLWEQRSYTT